MYILLYIYMDTHRHAHILLLFCWKDHKKVPLWHNWQKMYFKFYPIKSFMFWVSGGWWKQIKMLIFCASLYWDWEGPDLELLSALRDTMGDFKYHLLRDIAKLLHNMILETAPRGLDNWQGDPTDCTMITSVIRYLEVWQSEQFGDMISMINRKENYSTQINRCWFNFFLYFSTGITIYFLVKIIKTFSYFSCLERGKNEFWQRKINGFVLLRLKYCGCPGAI